MSARTVPALAGGSLPMDGPARHPLPGWGAVAREQLRAVGLRMRRELVTVAVFLLALASALLLVAHLGTPGHRTDMQFAEMSMAACLMAAFVPLAVWRGEQPARRGYLWSLPVARGPHTWARLLAGWVWLMLAVGVFMLWMALLARATDGELSLASTRVLLRPLPDEAVATPADLFHHRWPVAAWQWITPFTSATAVYLLGSILVLVSDHPWRWYAGIFFAWFTLLLAQVGPIETATNWVLMGRAGLEPLVVGAHTRVLAVSSPAGGQVDHYVFVPMLSSWALATLLWMGLGLLGVALAARKYQER